MSMGGEIPTLGIFILETKHAEYEKGNTARMRGVTFSKGYGRSVAAWNQEWYLGFLIIFLFFLLRHRALQIMKLLR